MSIQTIATWIGVITGGATFLGVMLRYVVLGIRAITLASNNLNTIMTNHLPHIYEELKSINTKLYDIRGEHETREDLFSHTRGGREYQVGLQPHFHEHGVVDGGSPGSVETGE